MSYDTPQAQKAFREGQNFEFRLIADTNRQISEAFRAARPADHQYKDWPKRVTYLVGPDGTVQQSWKVDDVKAHADEVLEVIRSKGGTPPG